jgi:importin subunit alpha-1
VPTLRSIGNIASGDDTCVDVLISCNIIKKVISLMLHEKKNIRKECCWLLSNIAAGTLDQVIYLCNLTEFHMNIKEILQSNVDWTVKLETFWVMANCMSK